MATTGASGPSAATVAKVRAVLALALGVGINSRLAVADMYHYADGLVGDRAAGLGGAYAAVANDASGVVYNPGGLAFAESDQISASANTFSRRKTVSKGAYGGNDIVVASSGQNSFFGGTHRFRTGHGDLVGGFVLYTPDNENMDQEYALGAAPELDVTRVYSRQKTEYSSTHAVGALAINVGPTVGIGLSLGYVRYSLSGQAYVDGVLGPLQTTTPLASPIFNNIAQNDVLNLEADALEFGLGGRIALTSALDVGVMIGDGRVFHQSVQAKERLNTIVTHADGTPLTATEVGSANLDKARYSHAETEANDGDIFGRYPLQLRAGLAWRPAQGATLCTDVTYFGRHSGDDIGVLAVWKPVVNLAAGYEQKVTSAIATRVGLFTNKDASPDPRTDGNALSESRIDYLGTTLFLGLKRGDSEYSIGTIYQRGSGKTSAVKTTDQQPIQAASADSLSLALSLASGL